MSLKQHCDICDQVTPNYTEYKIKKRIWLWYEAVWNRIEICPTCLDQIKRNSINSMKELT